MKKADTMDTPEAVTTKVRIPRPREYYVDAAAAAKFLAIDRRTLLQMVREGLVPAHPLREEAARKLWRFLLSELDAWLRGRVNSACRPCSSTERNVQ